MSDTYKPMGSDSPDNPQEELDLALGYQDYLLEQIDRALQQHLEKAISSQEAMLKTVYKPRIADISRKVKEQGTILSDLTTYLTGCVHDMILGRDGELELIKRHCYGKDISGSSDKWVSSGTNEQEGTQEENQSQDQNTTQSPTVQTSQGFQPSNPANGGQTGVGPRVLGGGGSGGLTSGQGTTWRSYGPSSGGTNPTGGSPGGSGGSPGTGGSGGSPGTGGSGGSPGGGSPGSPGGGSPGGSSPGGSGGSPGGSGGSPGTGGTNGPTGGSGGSGGSSGGSGGSTPGSPGGGSGGGRMNEFPSTPDSSGGRGGGVGGTHDTDNEGGGSSPGSGSGGDKQCPPCLIPWPQCPPTTGGSGGSGGTNDPTRPRRGGVLGTHDVDDTGNNPGGVAPPLVNDPNQIALCNINLDWRPEDAQFCVSLDRLMAELTNLALRAQQAWIDSINPDLISDTLNLIRTLIPGGQFLPAPPPAHVQSLFTEGLRLFRQCLVNLNVAELGNRSNVVIGLWFLRAIVKAFENLTVGWELGPQALTTINVELTQVTRIVNYLIEWVWPVNTTTQPDTDSLFLSDQISIDHWDCLTRLQGNRPGLYQLVMNAKRSRPTDFDQLRVWHRLDRDRNNLSSLMRTYGWLNDADINKQLEAFKFVPPPSDLIRFAVKDIFDPNKPGRQQMVAELQEQQDMLGLFAAQGIVPIQAKHPDGRMVNYDIPFLYWAASYEELPATHAYQLLHRLRPNRVHRYQFRDAQGNLVTPAPFSFTDVLRALKEKDINPVYRDRLAAISYHTIGRIDARRFYKLGIFGQPEGPAGFVQLADGTINPTGLAERELVEVYMDMGYTQQDAARQALFTAKDSDLAAKKPYLNKLKKSVADGIKYGLFDNVRGRQILIDAGINRGEADAISAQVNNEIQIDEAKKAIAAIRKQFLRAIINDIQAQASLTTFGIRPDRVEQMLRVWRIELAGRQKDLTVTQLCQFYQHGIIDLNTMRIRLHNLMYPATDVERIIRHCVIGGMAKDAKERQARVRAAIKDEKERQAMLDKAKDKAEKQRKARIAREVEGRTQANLKRWYAMGLVDDVEVRTSLRLMEWTDETIDLLLREWDEGKAPEKEEDKPEEN